MLYCIMIFLDRAAEVDRLDRLATRHAAGLAVLYGRRRVGKTRLLLEWAAAHDGLYSVADQSSAEVQRQYFAAAVAQRIDGFADVAYPDWRTLLARLARDARHLRWRGPVILDEFPYLVLGSPELPSVLQQWIDHEASDAKLVVALAGSSQRMMQGLVLSRNAPLYGRAQEILEITPLEPSFLRAALRPKTAPELVECYTAWGGVPRYWELARDETGSTRSRVERLVLDPLGPLHREPDRLLIEEVPSAVEVRPVLDAIGAGAHRVSEIAARVGRPATSMPRPLDRLVGMGLARREIPFGESEKKSRRSLYRIDDPFFRLWFRTVAPHRGQLTAGSRQARLRLLDKYWDGLAAAAWEDLCRRSVSRQPESSPLGRLGPWGPASRWWKGTSAEWDLAAESLDGRRLLLGEAKWSARPFGKTTVERTLRALAVKEAPSLPRKYADREVIRALFVPATTTDIHDHSSEQLVVTAAEVVP
jgi:AAA+ ATPase superfamily predicted ATPase